ncbi:site-2 protease family protein [Streptomyces sp. enrichment culture]|uniref:site-2 protease family protein n=1 Tax=Streptomyces sp. enrichment culture TaxID=1795815 RepID=UPI003F56EC7A
MEASGGRGRPRSGDGESTEHRPGRSDPAPDDTTTRDGGQGPAPDGHGRPEAARPGTAPATGTAPGPGDDGAPHPAPPAPGAPAGDPGRTAPEAPAGGPPPPTEPSAAPGGPDRPGGAPGGPAAPGRPTDPGGPTDPRDGTAPLPASDEAPRPGVPPAPPGPPAGPQGTPHGTDDRARAASGSGRGPQRPPEQQRGGLLMGRPFGVPVYVAPSWFLVAILITWVFGGQIDRVLPELGAASYLVSLFFAVAFYASVLVHELAHTLAALRFKLPVRRIQLQFFGGVSEIEKEAETPGREFVLAFVGPLLSLVLSGVFYLGLLVVDPASVPGVLLAGLMISNLIVAVFNLLPGLPLDGGRMLRAVVWKLTGKPMSGTVAAAWVGRALAVSVLIGLPLLTQTGALGSDAQDGVGMDTVLDALLAAILAAIIWTGAGNSLRVARLREHLPELRARTLTRRAVPVENDTPLSEALRRANAAGARALVVVDPDGTPLSLVREAAIVGVPEHRRPWVPVSGLSQDITDGMRVSAELAGEDLLEVLRATPATEYLVVEDTGEIYGVLSAADVERAFVKAMARPS